MGTGQPDSAVLVLRQAALELWAKTNSCSNVQGVKPAPGRAVNAVVTKRPKFMLVTQNIHGYDITTMT